MIYAPNYTLAQTRERLEEAVKSSVTAAAILQESVANGTDSTAASTLARASNDVHHLTAIVAVLSKFEEHEAKLAKEEDLSLMTASLRRYRFLLNLHLRATRTDDFSGRGNDANRSFNDGLRIAISALQTHVEELARA